MNVGNFSDKWTFDKTFRIYLPAAKPHLHDRDGDSSGLWRAMGHFATAFEVFVGEAFWGRWLTLPHISQNSTFLLYSHDKLTARLALIKSRYRGERDDVWDKDEARSLVSLVRTLTLLACDTYKTPKSRLAAAGVPWCNGRQVLSASQSTPFTFTIRKH